MKNLHSEDGMRRLGELADLLDTTSCARFNFAHFAGKDWGGKPDLSCGTSACGLGLATTMPEMQKLGLALVGGMGISHPYVALLSPEGRVRERNSFKAGAEVFDITEEEAKYLFLPCEQDGGPLSEDCEPSELADHIRRFIENPVVPDIMDFEFYD